jgi:hypothetical protein
MLLGYDVGVQALVYTEVEAGAGGMAIVALTPGQYDVNLHAYQAAISVVPDHRQTVTVVLNAYRDSEISVPFDLSGPVVTPSPTPSPTPTKVVTYPCPDYQANPPMCRPTCDGTYVRDWQGQCGAGLMCCRLAPTATAVKP